MKIKEVKAKTILSESKVFPWTVNPYIGCQHGCTYCYARFMRRYTGHQEAWGKFVDVKVNAPELLLKEGRIKKKGRVWLSGVCDPYQPIEKKYQITRKCLEILQKNNWPVTIQTKSPLILRDLDILKKAKGLQVTLTITTADERIRKIFEPYAPSIEERIRTLGKLHQEKIRTCAMIAPLLPKAENLAFKLKGKVDEVIIDKMNYHYADWVFEKYQLKKQEKGESLAWFFRKEGVSCRVIF